MTTTNIIKSATIVLLPQIVNSSLRGFATITLKNPPLLLSDIAIHEKIPGVIYCLFPKKKPPHHNNFYWLPLDKNFKQEIEAAVQKEFSRLTISRALDYWEEERGC